MSRASGGVVWSHSEEVPMDSRAICMSNDRIYVCSFGNYLSCLDATDGKEIWRRTAEEDADVFAAIGPYRSGHGYIMGWKRAILRLISAANKDSDCR